jgi:ELWxxDGT repeat protein
MPTYFSKVVGSNLQLWSTDGTIVGTHAVGTVDNTAAATDHIYYLTADGGSVYFVSTDGTNGYELWKSDGSAAGTMMVKDIYVGGNSFPSDLTVVNGVVYFSATDATRGTELWRSDGTSSGTTIVKDIRPGATSSTPFYFVGSTANPHFLVSGSTFYFAANDGTLGI